ncbi:MAG: nicotinate phosphoribosyltransferase [Firmicutes bacterium]|nr:nicotinate phosphoribosyltransferase [Bacillota bacterium]NLL88276.1 nicotinate phosphoribosyltransferase [Bacillota bacterium]HKM18064.1 nicotinate phosphoribosyltransferase [Limnochordia bacterium]
MKSLQSIQDVTSYRVEDGRRLYSANHDEILAGLTTDVYFVKTRQILETQGYQNTEVVAEIFPRRSGIIAGVEEALNLLRDLDVQVEALPEGTPFSAKDVVMRIRGLYTEFGIYETAVLGILAHSSGWATAAHEVKQVTKDKPFFCFGARHVHPAVAPVMERAAIIGGARGASCILGAKLARVEPSGTVPHALFLIVGDTVDAARMYDQIMPSESPRTILVDTFKDEVEESLRVAEALGAQLEAIRLDTPGERGGVTAALVRELRAKLDLAGYQHVQIFASGGLDLEKIRLLSQAGADAFGVGSYISSAVPIDMTMDIKEINGMPVAKRGRLPGVTPNDAMVKVK